MLRWIIGALVVGLVARSAVSQSNPVPSNDLFESGQASKMLAAPAAPKEITLVSYNIRWRTESDLRQIIDWLRQNNAAIIGLQEVDRAKRRTNRTNNARVLAEQLGMYYAWVAPPAPKGSKEEETGVELLSAYPLTEITRIVLPHQGPGGRFRVALGATVRISKAGLRVYSVHSETRIDVTAKMDQFRAVLDDLARFPSSMPAIVMGDFNSWEPATVEGVRNLFTSEGWTTPFSDEPTFKRNAVLFDLELKLDWIWLRGRQVKSAGIDRSLTVSDHYPLWTIVSLMK